MPLNTVLRLSTVAAFGGCWMQAWAAAPPDADAPGAAAAVEPDGAVNPAVQAAVDASATDELHAIALARFVAYERGLTMRCDTVVPDWDQASLLIYQGDPTLDTDGRIERALWVVTVPGQACGHRRAFRIRVEFVAGTRTVVGMLPGTGISSPDLDPDSIPAVRQGVAGHLHRHCPVDVLNTRLMGGSSVAADQPWQEIWTVRACGAMLSVPVRFTPDDDDDGTAIDLNPDDIVPAN